MVIKHSNIVCLALETLLANPIEKWKKKKHWRVCEIWQVTAILERICIMEKLVENLI